MVSCISPFQLSPVDILKSTSREPKKDSKLACLLSVSPCFTLPKRDIPITA